METKKKGEEKEGKRQRNENWSEDKQGHWVNFLFCETLININVWFWIIFVKNVILINNGC